MSDRRPRIGIFGGSFDPVHAGHMMLAQYLAEFGGLDSVMLMLSARNPVKDAAAVADADRLAMLRMACDSVPRVEPCDIELSMPRPSYTYDTLCLLRRLRPDTDFVLLIGADNWTIFDRWRNADRICAEFDILIYPRRGYDVDPAAMPPRVSYCADAPVIEVSSTFLRRAVAEGRCVSQFMPAGVYDYIIKHRLYATDNLTQP